MKKSLLALAVLGAVAGVANAQTNVTVYGVVDAGIARESGDVAGTAWKLASGVQSGNRLGFKGTEDLGGGLKANFQLENGFNVDTGTQRQGALFGRQAFVGLSGNFGAVNLGRQYNPLFIALDSIDPFGTGLTGASTNLMAGGSNGDVRVNNAITYTSPNMSGLSATALYGFGEQAGDTSKNRNYALSANYANGPVAAVLAYSNTNDNAASPNSAKVWLIGGTYDLGVVKAHLAYESEKADANFPTVGGADFRDWMAGVSAPVAGGTVMASYIKKTDKTNSAEGAKQYAVGYTYPLSKRTNVYTSYSRVTNDSNAQFFAGDASSGGPSDAAGNNTQKVGGTSTGFAVGIRHTF
ncbi:porin [Noviherbaspirillum sp. UKPF54]|uniref:porin n=1 Tax=Noviherbaspirillum sp. UKPF54 TaxID=2601898 RepID=UPI0011B1BC3C|nr:porin [Noviherbaspirillum sp. UKPF54]QDZ30292.1 porin [Noviherbaspirillum sp. UKPF54]